jgi:hypothetical protein
MTQFKMAAAAIFEKGEVLKLLNRSTDCHHILQASSIGDAFYEKLVTYNIFTKSKMAADAILKIDKVL